MMTPSIQMRVDAGISDNFKPHTFISIVHPDGREVEYGFVPGRIDITGSGANESPHWSDYETERVPLTQSQYEQVMEMINRSIGDPPQYIVTGAPGDAANCTEWAIDAWRRSGAPDIPGVTVPMPVPGPNVPFVWSPYEQAWWMFVRDAVRAFWRIAVTPRRRDPLAIDLDGDGIETLGTSSAGGSILFDHDADGVRTGTGWLKGDDAWLVLDRDANGSIDSGRELFGVDTIIQRRLHDGSLGEGFAANGFQALASLDTNGTGGAADSRFDAQDAAFGQVRLWRDLNGDGVSQAGELTTLGDAGITSIQLSYMENSVDLGNGNRSTGSATVSRAGGANVAVVGVDLVASNLELAHSPFYREFPDRIPCSADAASLPNMRGSGWLRDLREAMSLGTPAASDLVARVRDFATTPTRAGQLAGLDAVIDAWAHTTGRVNEVANMGYVGDWVRQEIAGQTGDTQIFHFEAADPDDYPSYWNGNGQVYDMAVYRFESSDLMRDELVDGRVRSVPNDHAMAWLERKNLLEAFNGQRFIDFTIVGTAGGGGAGGGGGGGGVPITGPVLRYDIVIANPQVEALNRAWDELRESVYRALVVQTRLAPYLDAIRLEVDAGQVRFRTEDAQALLDATFLSQPEKAIVDLGELVRFLQPTLDAVGLDALATLRTWTEALPVDSPWLQALADVGVAVGATLVPTQKEDVFVGGAGDNVASGGDGDDVLDGGGCNDRLNGDFGDDRLYGRSGDDVLHGGDGDDLLNGGAGNDGLNGSRGNNVYVFGRGDGQDLITADYDANGDKCSVIEFKGGVLSSDVILRRVYDSGYESLELSIAGTSDKITARYFFNGDDPVNPYNGVQLVRFADGTAWDLAAIVAKALGGSDANDQIKGTLHANTIFGRADDDTLHGQAGDDTLNGGEGVDHLDGGAGRDLLQGEAGNDTLYGGDGEDTLDGGAGNDSLNGGRGNNVYLFGRGDGQDILAADYDPSAGKLNVIEFKSGVLPSDVVARRVYDQGYESLELSIAGTSDSIRVRYFFQGDDPTGAFNGVQQVRFADGSTWTLDTILAKVFAGTADNDDIKGTLNGETIAGQAGNDILNGQAGNDVLLGGEGTDQLNGGLGDDTLDGGAGNDSLNGGRGNNVYLFGRGDGQDILTADYDPTAGKLNVIEFKSGVLPSDVVARRVYDQGYESLELSIAGTSDKITARYFFNGDNPVNPYNGVQVVRFADGSTWNLDTILAKVFAGTADNDDIKGTLNGETIAGQAGNDILNGQAGNDVLLGGEGTDQLNGGLGDDTLDGGAGNDSLNGGRGNNVYLFGRGDGQDILAADYDPSAGKLNVIEFKPGVLASDVIARRVYDSGYESLELSIAGTSDSIRVRYFFAGDDPSNPFNGVQEVRFADGTGWNTESLLAKVFAGTADNDDIKGTLNGNAISGQTGNDVLHGQGGNDTLAGGDGADQLNGGLGDDTLDGGAGIDALNGGRGNNVYVFGRGDGQDTVCADYDPAVTRRSTIQFEPDVTPGDLVLRRVNDSGYDSLEVVIAGTSDKITVRYFFHGDDPHNPYNGVQQVRFADGTTWDLATIVARTLEGTHGSDTIKGTVGDDALHGHGGDDVLFGAGGADRIEGGAGNDILNGWRGNNTYVFGRGDGQDLVAADYESDAGRLNTIEFKPDVMPGDVVVRRVYSGGSDNLELSIAGTSDKITVRHFFYGDNAVNPYNGVQQVRFADGSTWDLAAIVAKTLEGTSGDDSIKGTLHADAIVGGAGNDTLEGQGGNDTLVGGDGSDRLDGVWGDDQLDGGAGDDVLFGGDGADRLVGGTGNDVLNGWRGNNTYLFGRGDGQDLVAADYESDVGRLNTIEFRSDVLPSDVVARRVSDAGYQNLELSIAGTSDKITVRQFFYSDNPVNPYNGVQQVRFADGTVWNLAALQAQVQQNGNAQLSEKVQPLSAGLDAARMSLDGQLGSLVSAMAAFSAAAGCDSASAHWREGAFPALLVGSPGLAIA